MSVINQMLKDLEQRQEQMTPGRYQPPLRGRRIWWRAWPALGLPLLAYGALWLWSQVAPLEAVTPGETASPDLAGVATEGGEPAAQSEEMKPAPSAAPHQPLATAEPAPMSLAAQSASPEVAPGPSTMPAGRTAPQLESAEPAGRTASAQAQAEVVPTQALESAVSGPAQTELAPSAASGRAESAQLESRDDGALAQASDDELLGPDLYAGREASDAVTTQPSVEPQVSVEPQGSLEIEEVLLTPSQEAALQRRKANQAIARGDLAQARQALFRVLQQEPQDHLSRQRLAGLLYGEERLQEASALLEQGVVLAPHHADFRLLLARIALARGEKSSALAYLNSLDPEVRRNLDYYATRAALAQELGHYSAAAASYLQLTRAQPAEGRWWLGLAIAYDKQGRQLAARDAYLKAQGASGLSAAALNFAQQRYAQLEQG